MDFIKSELFWVNIAEGETKHLEITLPPPNWASTLYSVTILTFAGLGSMLFGAIGLGIGVVIGAILSNRLASKPQFTERNL